MSLFGQQVAKATPTDNQGLWFEAGQYPLIQVDQVKLIVSQKPGELGTEKLVMVFDILDSKVPTRPAGMRGVAHVLNSKHAGAADDAKRFLLALFPEVSPDSIDDAAITAITSAAQPAHGRLVSLECYVKKSSKTQKDFTKHVYRAVDKTMQAQAAELRAKAGLTAF